jgi:hypothetical protein
MAYKDLGDGDHHDEQIDRDGDLQIFNGLCQVLSVFMPSLLCSTFICDDVFVYMEAVVK